MCEARTYFFLLWIPWLCVEILQSARLSVELAQAQIIHCLPLIFKIQHKIYAHRSHYNRRGRSLIWYLMGCETLSSNLKLFRIWDDQQNFRSDSFNSSAKLSTNVQINHEIVIIIYQIEFPACVWRGPFWTALIASNPLPISLICRRNEWINKWVANRRSLFTSNLFRLAVYIDSQIL